jgi:hypothetical protein
MAPAVPCESSTIQLWAEQSRKSVANPSRWRRHRFMREGEGTILISSAPAGGFAALDVVRHTNPSEGWFGPRFRA